MIKRISDVTQWPACIQIGRSVSEVTVTIPVLDSYKIVIEDLLMAANQEKRQDLGILAQQLLHVSGLKE